MARAHSRADAEPGWSSARLNRLVRQAIGPRERTAAGAVGVDHVKRVNTIQPGAEDDLLPVRRPRRPPVIRIR